MREEDEFESECSSSSQDKRISTKNSTAGATPTIITSKTGTEHKGRRWGRSIACLLGSLLVVLTMLGVPATSKAGIHIGVMVSFGPPALPYYAQPPCPGPGYIWTPGYWAWDPAYGYYWVPGTWVAAPFVGALWTPGYWGFDRDGYRWHPGYWGWRVGFYGDIDYGYGYTGFGYDGGYWDHDRFFYNRAVNRIDRGNIRDFYYQREIEHHRFRGISYHGGPGGTVGRPTRGQLAAARMRRFGPVGQQLRQRRFARRDPAQRWRMNHGRPAIAATRMPGRFHGNGIVPAIRAGGHYRSPRQRMTHNFRHGRPAPVQVRNQQRFARQQFNHPQRYGPFRGPMQRRAPVRQQRVYQRPQQRRFSPQFARHNQFRGRPQQARQPRFYARRQQHGPPQHQQFHGGGHGGNNHGGGQNHARGRGRGGRH